MAGHAGRGDRVTTQSDRMWNRVADLEELAGLEPGAWEQFARAVVDCAVTGRWPGLGRSSP